MGVAYKVQFFKKDSEHAHWDYPDPLDYIQLRCIMGCFDDHRMVIRKSVENLDPGVWMKLSAQSSLLTAQMALYKIRILNGCSRSWNG